MLQEKFKDVVSKEISPDQNMKLWKERGGRGRKMEGWREGGEEGRREKGKEGRERREKSKSLEMAKMKQIYHFLT